MATGVVKWFNTQKGYGFIQPEDGGRDVFVHISSVERAGMSSLNEGQKINYELVTENLGHKPVISVIYSHSHADHYAGVGGVTNAADVAAGKVSVIAPAGFLKEAVSENIIAGPAMLRRARYQFGLTLKPRTW